MCVNFAVEIVNVKIIMGQHNIMSLKCFYNLLHHGVRRKMTIIGQRKLYVRDTYSPVHIRINILKALAVTPMK